MDLLCGLEICVALPEDDQGTTYLFPCLLPPLENPSELSDFDSHIRSGLIVTRGHRFREVSGFIPPGLFVGLLARLFRKTKSKTMYPTQMWKDHALLFFNNNATYVLLKSNVESATIDVIGWASENEQMFVGAAKGQACVVNWIVHWIKIFLGQYSQLQFQESRLCPNPKCHGINGNQNGSSQVPYHYVGSEFLLNLKHASKVVHDCDVDGCFRFLGGGHSLERTELQSNSIEVCRSCNTKPIFILRDRV